ncbi:MAG TPA: DNA repair exonuclease [Polyangiaceae bacterium]|nr:DNA repair exonuclease [Polyangiaceae bacterium]
MKFVHAADLHLDSPLRGLSRYEGAPVAEMRGATRRAFKNLVDLCLHERAAFLLLAGDIYDGNWKDYSTGLFFASELSRLRAANVPVVLLRGNHDAASQITRHLRLPDNVHELAVKSPETIELSSLGVCVHGQGFATRAVTDDLAKDYPDARPGAFNIGLLHTSAGGREGHENYAPCRVETLVGKGYDYWALGHVHAREVLCEEPFVLFPGNLQGRHIRETGPKGASLVAVAGGRVASVEHRPLDVVRWCVLDIDVTEATTGADVVDVVRDAVDHALADAGELPLAARIVLSGRTDAHAALTSSPEQYESEIRAAVTDLADGGAFVERIVLSTRSTLDLAAVRTQDDAVGQLARTLHAMRNSPDELRSLLPELAELKQRLPLELREGERALSLDEAHLADLVAEVEEMLIPRLLGGALGR